MILFYFSFSSCHLHSLLLLKVYQWIVKRSDIARSLYGLGKNAYKCLIELIWVEF